MKYLYIFIFTLLSFTSFAEDGDSFENAIAIDANGTVTFPANTETLYYTFNIPEDQVIYIPHNDTFDIVLYDTQESEITYGFDGRLKEYISSGSYYLSVESNIADSFEWLLSTRNALEGEYCQSPYELTESGRIHFFGTSYDPFYCSFTAESNGHICFKNIPFSKVEIFDACGGNSLLKKLDVDAFSFPVTTGESYIIEIYDALHPEFIFDFTLADGMGESCDNAIELSNYGTITAPIGSGISYFSFIVPEDGIFNITSTEETDGDTDSNTTISQVELYGSCADAAIGSYLEFSLSGNLSYEAHAGDEYIIALDIPVKGFSTEPFSWNLSRESQIGSGCGNAYVIEATGDVDFPDGMAEYYYDYTATSDCKIEITNGDLNRSVYVKTDCDNSQWDFMDSYGEITILAVEGVTYHIKWESDFYTQAAFTWNIQEVAYSGGENCEHPQVIATSGDVDFAQNEGMWYYSYTATMNGALRISDGAKSNTLQVYTDCSQGNLEYTQYGDLVISSEQGVTYIIEWENNSYQPFAWTISEDAGENGEVIANPILIDSWGNEASPSEFPVTREGYVYYSFTATVSQMLTFTDDNKYNEISIWPEGDLNALNYDGSGELSCLIEAGKTYIIRWNSFNDSFSWFAYVRNLLEGETQSNPIIIAQAGEVNYPDGRSAVYYSYTPSSNGVVELSTDDDNAWASPSSAEVIANEAFVFSYNNYMETAFTFILTIRNSLDGEFCSDPIEVGNDGIATTSADLSNSYLSYTAGAHAIVSFTNGDLNKGINVMSGCSYYDESYFSYYGNGGEIALELQENQSIILSCFNSKEEISWTITEADPEVGEIRSNPQLIREQGTIDYFGIEKNLVYNYYEYTPLKNEQLVFPATGSFMICDEGTSDTLFDSYYEQFTLEVVKNNTYLVIAERLNNTESTWAFITNQSSVAEQGVMFVVSDNYQAIENAQITINNQSLTTDAQGNSWVALNNGSYTYQITADGYKDHSGEVKLEGYSQDVIAMLSPDVEDDYTLTFRITNDGNPLQGANITINGETFQTSDNGIAFVVLEDGDYSYSVSASGFQSYTESVSIVDQNAFVNVELIVSTIPNYTVSFMVSNDGNAVEGASIAINSEALITGADGIAFVVLEEGDYSYSISAAGFQPYSESVSVIDQDVSVEVILVATTTATYTVSFYVSDENQAVEGASISINELTLITNAEGEAQTELESGTYDFTVTSADFQEYTAQCVVDGAPKQVDVTLEPVGMWDQQSVIVDVFPNPVTNRLIINSKEQITGIHIYTIDGKSIYCNDWTQNEIQVSSWPNGLYIIKIQTQTQSIQKRILKQ